VGFLDSSAMWEGRADDEARLRTSMRRPRERASWAGCGALEAERRLPDLLVAVHMRCVSRRTFLAGVISPQSVVLVDSI
jgi:hypothetical protein